MDIEAILSELEKGANLRHFPNELSEGIVDFTSNDYLGIAADETLRDDFFAKHSPTELCMTSSASRLLAANQRHYLSLETCIEESYGQGRKALLFNSGYHANTGIIPALADRSGTILADRLVHASIIDGMKLSGAQFTRFPHNDFDYLEKLLEQQASKGRLADTIVAIESVYSMDGDKADLRRLVDLKRSYPEIILYVDEAHAVGVCGPGGLGESVAQGVAAEIDILVGTFGKALASDGAYVLTGSRMKDYLINKARSLIFSTALPPAQTMWTEHTWRHMLANDTARKKLAENARMLAEIIPGGAASHIRPYIVGDSRKA